MTFDEKLAQALGESFDERMEQRFAVTQEHRFSLAYKLWEHKTLKNLRKNRYDKRWTLRRARYIVFAGIMILSLLLGATVYAVATSRFSFVTSPGNSKLLFVEWQSSDKRFFEEYYGLPEDNNWELVTSFVNMDGRAKTFSACYECDEKRAVLAQNIISGKLNNYVKLDNATTSSVTVFEQNDGFFVERGGNYTLYWINDGYLFELSGNIDKDEMLDLALSTKIIEYLEHP